jgi:diguanylate cyclase (GGDEF)-like protein
MWFDTMDFFTAGIAFIATQLCMTLVMAGVYWTTPNEKCTRYWAWAEGLIAFGVLLIVLNGGAPRYAIIVLGNNSLVCGTILQWWGLQAFYGKQPGKIGWFIGAVFFVLHGFLLAADAPMGPRIFLLATTFLALLILSFRTVWNGTASERTFGTRLVLGTLAVLIANNALRNIAVLLGFLSVGPATRSFTGVTVLYLVPLAGILLYATGLLLLYFERMVKEKHHLGTHDELTGLLNRRATIAGGEREIALAARDRRALAVAFIDIDFFKRINDSLGHEAGDMVLVEIAQLLKKSCRDIDLVGRYGGEEFCIIFPGADAAQAVIVGRRLLTTIASYRFRDRHPVTVSLGLAVLEVGASDRSWNTLINRADAELYRAKDMGRNRFCIAPDASDVVDNVSLQLAGDEPDHKLFYRKPR